MRVHPRDLRLREGVGKRREPTLRPPLPRVRAPERRARVGSVDRDEDECVLRDEDGVHERAVGAAHGLRQREDAVCARPKEAGISAKRYAREQNEKRTRGTGGAWAGSCHIGRLVEGMLSGKQLIHAKCLSVHRVEVWERHKLVVCESTAAAMRVFGRRDLLP